MLIYRIVHSSQDERGPFQRGHLRKPWDRTDNMDLLMEYDVFHVESGRGYIPGSEFYLDSDVNHVPVIYLACFDNCIKNKWLVGCLSLSDLAHWFNTDGVLLALEQLGYVVKVYDVSHRKFVVSHTKTRQCMFDSKESIFVKQLSVLDVAEHIPRVCGWWILLWMQYSFLELALLPSTQT